MDIAGRVRTMTSPQSPFDAVEVIALLEEPNRKRLYDFVAASPEAVGRDAAAAALVMSRELAAFHLDRLAHAGLLQVEYRRLGGRSGPGAGRPAKLYRRANRELAVTLPPRHYDLAADLMATALDRLGSASATEVADMVARERGTATGTAARRSLSPRASTRKRLASLVDVLAEAGYEPRVDPGSGDISLRNCPYHALSENHRNLTCGMNLAWAEGVVDSLGAPVTAELAPETGRCCVVFHPAPTSEAEAGERL
jgi:predicted ArsR family transcriptional regulator